jgi:hypothetical protein
LVCGESLAGSWATSLTTWTALLSGFSSTLRQASQAPRFKKKDIKDRFALREKPKIEVVERKRRFEKLKTLIPGARKCALEAHHNKLPLIKV